MITVVEPNKEKAEVMPLQHIGIVIPTLNAAHHWPQLHAALQLQGIPAGHILIIDSESTDGTQELATKAGYQLLPISRREFNHGKTRGLALDLLPDAEILVYITQDALPASADAVTLLCEAFNDPQIGAVYGRQLPRPGAGLIEQYARYFNYPETGQLRTFEDRKRLGIRAAFMSNSFGAYRTTALRDVGNFPIDVVVAEDSVVAARMLMAGWKILYRAEAAVIHSHPLTIVEEFRRYFDTGAHHSREYWLLREFGTAGGEGMRYVLAELRFLARKNMLLIPKAIVRTFGKYIGYQLGLRHEHLPLRLKLMFTLQKRFWLTTGSMPRDA